MNPLAAVANWGLQQPPYPLAIDWSHPFTPWISFIFEGNKSGAPFDLCGNAFIRTITGTLASTGHNSIYGKGVKTERTSPFGNFLYDIEIPPSIHPFSVEFIGRVETATTDWICGIGNTAQANACHGIGVANTPAWRAQSMRSSATRIASLNGVTTEIQHVVGVFPTSNARTLYVRGLGSATDSTSQTEHTGQDTLVMGGRVDETNPPADVSDSRIYKMNVYRRALTVKEVGWLFGNPWGQYKPAA